ncbi:hypothetical protein TrCOL_g1541 [Triparma columacea]|uniref:Uncharacterized protein n=1 Tax=Triparma columacea TaxID=722753 RepID=A0A9W7GAH3_9STRA|nr:hypothetical protein TrCOL_g1541 [Triparma columacea]
MGKSKSKKSSEPPKCACDHPYNCDCGNRPPRPSRGHKWDPLTQSWGGKGHKQKGATIAGAVVGKKEAVNRGGVEVKEGQKVPSMLMSEWCKKGKRRPPKFKNLGDSGKFRFRVILPDTKNPAKDLCFVSGTDARSEDVGKEEVCLVALNQLEGKKGLDLYLPEPYKTQWRVMQGGGTRDDKTQGRRGKAGSAGAGEGGGNSGVSMGKPPTRLVMQNRFASKDEENKHNETAGKLRKETMQKRENRKAANKPYGVSMSGKVRAAVEKVVGLKGGLNAHAGNLNDNSGKGSIIEYLRDPNTGGFTLEQASIAARCNANIVDAICWLVRRMEEKELPGKWKPKDGVGGVEVVGKCYTNDGGESREVKVGKGKDGRGGGEGNEGGVRGGVVVGGPSEGDSVEVKEGWEFGFVKRDVEKGEGEGKLIERLHDIALGGKIEGGEEEVCDTMEQVSMGGRGRPFAGRRRGRGGSEGEV